MSIFSAYLATSELRGIEVGTTVSGRPFVAFNSARQDALTVIDDTGHLAEMLRQAAADIESRYTPELWAVGQ